MKIIHGQIAVAFVAITFLVTPAGADEGWVSLFDGKTLNGWVQKNGTAIYRVQNGTVLGRTNEGSPNSFLCTEKTYADFELEFDVKVANALNSGVQIRSKTKGSPTGRVYGPQVEIEASGKNGAEAGYVYGEATGRGWLTPKERLSELKNVAKQWEEITDSNHINILKTEIGITSK